MFFSQFWSLHKYLFLCMYLFRNKTINLKRDGFPLCITAMQGLLKNVVWPTTLVGAF